MITQEITMTTLMKPFNNLIVRKGDYGNQIKLNFPSLDGITSVEFRMVKPDGTSVVNSAEISENSVIITITDEMTDITGKGYYNLKLINNSSNIYTYVGRVIIDINLNIESEGD